MELRRRTSVFNDTFALVETWKHIPASEAIQRLQNLNSSTVFSFKNAFYCIAIPLARPRQIYY